LALRPSRALLGGLIVLGLAALVFYFHWWLSYVGIAVPWLALLLAFVAVYNWSQLLLAWVLYWKATRRPEVHGLPSDLTVDLFLPIYNEPLPVIERALRAAMQVRGRSEVWVLDDGTDDAAQRLAQELGARYRRRAVRKDAKARPLIGRRLPRLPFATACPLPLAIDLEGPLSAPALACPAQRWRPPAAG